ncbi:MAG: aldo/keto reductase [Eggerthellaceae bacterium]|nr:aldo/keto reductase [Eggerthellaceae bacterium]
MQYRQDRYGNQLSILGYGCMRFPQKLGRIDMAATEAQIMTAFRKGVNYFDTAYIYAGSEAALGEILEKNDIRSQVYIATKLPQYLIKNVADLDKLFNEQLKRLRTDYVDYYLMHMLSDAVSWQRLKDLGIEEWIRQKRESGAIRQVGFSYHGNADTFNELIDVHDWDFCQIQYNYMDVNSQAGRRGLLHAHEKGVPVIIMEPLRGGKLVNQLPEEAKRIFAHYKTKRTPAQWAFRWLWSQPEVTVVLSGMNSEAMILDNIQTASDVQLGEIGPEDDAMLESVVRALNSKTKVECTACGYCMPCPKGVDIPGTFAAYNRRYSEGWYDAQYEYMMCTALRKNPASIANCTQCGLCERHCPQNIEIRARLQDAKKVLETPIYRIARKIIGLVMRF